MPGRSDETRYWKDLIMKNSTQSSSSQQQITICGMCHNHCGIKLQVDNGKIIGVEGWREHPHSQGKICIKASQIPEHVYHDARLKYPMKRENTEWHRISWEEALDAIAANLTQIREKYGPAALGCVCGDPVELAGEVGSFLAWRFCDVYGTPNRFHAGDMCYLPLAMGQIVTLGSVYEPDVENSKCIIVWADNPQATYPVMHSKILKARKRGARLIVVDPRKTPLAGGADIHIRPRPGTDGVIVLAMIHTIVSEQLYDRDLIDNWTSGFDKLAEHVKQYGAVEAERISGVPAEDIERAARIYATTPPASMQIGFKLAQTQCGFQISRSLAIMSAITGNIQVPGGDLHSFYLPKRPPRLPELMGDSKHPTAGQFPIHSEFPIFLFDGNMTNWGDLVLNEPRQLRSMIVSGANPAITWPNTKKVRNALNKLEFLVVMDVFMTATARMADIVLPACTFLEKMASIQWRGWSIRRPIIEPQWESQPDSKFWIGLAGRMGYGKYFPWKNDEEIIDYFFEPSGLTVRKIFELYPEGYIHDQTVPGEQQYRQEGFHTPSGKVELFSGLMDKIGQDPLPTYSEPRESPIRTPELFNDFPLVLTTGTRDLEWYHSEHRHLEGLRRRIPEPVAEIHPDTAAKYGIRDNEPMTIETKTGSLRIKARVSDDIMAEMISVPHGWDEAPENMLTDDRPADPITGFPALTALLCRVK